MRVLFASTHPYLPQFVGGSERSTHDLCRRMLTAGHEVAVLSGLKAGDLCWLKNRLRARLGRSYRFPPESFQGYPVYRGWNAAQGAAEVAERFAPTVAVLQAGEPLGLAEAFDGLRLPMLIYLRDVERLERYASIGPDRAAFVANSHFVASRARQKLGIDPAVIFPLIDYQKLATKTSRQTVTMVNPHPNKGGQIALELAKARPDIPFELFEGWRGGLVVESLRKEASKLPNVRWKTSVFDARRLYRKARILIVPSQCEEAWGRVVNEAQASGVPVIASDVGGLPESVGSGGILVSPPDDQRAWLHSLSRVWDDPEEYARLSAAALQNVRRPELQPDRLFAEFLAALKRLLARVQVAPPPNPTTTGA